MELSEWKIYAEIIKNLATGLGILVGGGWTVYRFGLFRERFPSIEMRNGIRLVGEGETENLYELTCVVENKGKTRKWLAPLEFEILGFRDEDFDKDGLFPISSSVNNEVRFLGLNNDRQKGEFDFSKMYWVNPKWTIPFVDGQSSRQFQYLIALSKDFKFLSLYSKFIDYNSRRTAVRHLLDATRFKMSKEQWKDMSQEERIRHNSNRRSDFYFAQITMSVKDLIDANSKDNNR